jgi:hypothetical protein
MIQFIWIFSDYLIFLSRLLISFIYFNLSYKIFAVDKIKGSILFLLSTSLALGIYTSVSSIILFIFELVNIIREAIKKQFQIEKLAILAYFIILLSAGPGWSLDKIFDIRLTN